MLGQWWPQGGSWRLWRAPAWVPRRVRPPEDWWVSDRGGGARGRGATSCRECSPRRLARDRAGHEANAARIEGIMNRSAFVDPAQRRAEYESHGWSRFDETAPAYSSAEWPPSALGRELGSSRRTARRVISWHRGDPGIRPGGGHKCKWRLSVASMDASKPAWHGSGARDRSANWLQYKRRQSERQRQSLTRVDGENRPFVSAAMRRPATLPEKRAAGQVVPDL